MVLINLSFLSPIFKELDGLYEHRVFLLITFESKISEYLLTETNPVDCKINSFVFTFPPSNECLWPGHSSKHVYFLKPLIGN